MERLEYERSQLTGRQKQTIFKKKMGELLLPNGFVFKKGKFIRVHPGQVLLCIMMQLHRQHSTILFGGMLFCTETRYIEDPYPGWREEDFIDHDENYHENFKSMFYVAFENGAFEKRYQVFRDKAFPGFNTITDVRSLLTFEVGVMEKERFRVSNDIKKMWGYIQIEEYNRALECAKKVVQRYTDDIIGCKERITEIKNDVNGYYRKIYSKSYRESAISREGKNIQMFQAAIEEYNRYVEALEVGQYDKLQDQIKRMIIENTEIARVKYPEFYK